MSDVWTCCRCGSANLTANAPERCPVCGHTRDSYCTTGRPAAANTYSLLYHPNAYPTAPSSSAGQSYRYSSTQHTSPSTASSLHTIPRYYTTSHASSYPSTSSPSSSSSRANPSALGNYSSARPSMRGWWICCCCRQSYNPDLVPDRCPTSGHKRCSSCRVWP